MKSKLLFILSLFITTVSAQQTYNLGWSTNGESVNQQLTVDVGDTVIWTWTSGYHNLVQVGSQSEPGFGQSAVTGPGTVYQHTFTTPGVHDYLCSPHPGSMFGAITVNESSASLEEASVLSISLYPNPSSDYIKIISSDLSETVKIDVFDVLGKQTFSDLTNDINNYSLDVSNLKSGIYFITISTKNKSSLNKFIKI